MKIVKIEEEVRIEQGNNVIVLEIGDRIRVFSEGNRVVPRIAKDIENAGNNERRRGGSVEINHRYGTVSVTLSNKESYFFQGDEADDLLNEIPDNVSEDDYIFWIAQGW